MVTSTTIDIEGFDKDALLALRSAIDDRLKRIAQSERAKARRTIVELAGEHKIDLAELATQTRSPAYRDPENAFNVWSGRGRQPTWVRERIAGGSTLEDLRAG